MIEESTSEAVWNTNCSHTELVGAMLSHLVPSGTVWSHLEPLGVIWGHLALSLYNYVLRPDKAVGSCRTTSCLGMVRQTDPLHHHVSRQVLSGPAIAYSTIGGPVARMH